MAQRLVNVVKAFSLNLNRTGKPEKLDFVTGVQRVDEDVAEHWYAKAHFGDMPGEDDKATPETAAALAELTKREEALAERERELAASVQVGEQLAISARKSQEAAEEREAELDVRKAELDQREADLKAREDKLAAEQSASSKKPGAK